MIVSFVLSTTLPKIFITLSNWIFSNLAKYSLFLSITPDLSDASQVDALPVGGNKGEFDWMINFEQTKNQGIYEIHKEKADGSGNFSVLFAANTDQLESNLKRIAPNEIRSKLESDNIKLLNYTELILEADVNINKSEVWKLVLIVLTVILLIELFYGWRIGARR